MSDATKYHASLVKDLCEIDEGLTPWEVQFVESISAQVLDRGAALTDKQCAIGEKILERLR